MHRLLAQGHWPRLQAHLGGQRRRWRGGLWLPHEGLLASKKADRKRPAVWPTRLRQPLKFGLSCSASSAQRVRLGLIFRKFSSASLVARIAVKSLASASPLLTSQSRRSSWACLMERFTCRDGGLGTKAHEGSSTSRPYSMPPAKLKEMV